MAKRPKNIRNLKRIGKTGNELNKQIELSCAFGELRRDLEDFEEIKKRKAIAELERQGGIWNRLPTTQGENGGDLGAAFREVWRMERVRIQARHNRKQMVKIGGLLSQEGG